MRLYRKISFQFKKQLSVISGLEALADVLPEVEMEDENPKPHLPISEED